MDTDRRDLLKSIPVALGVAGLGAAAAMAAPQGAVAATAAKAAAEPPFQPAGMGVTPALERTRRYMHEENVNMLTFHSMDQLFYTQPVAHGGPVWHLPRDDRELAFTYAFDGATYTPEQFYERSYTNALLVMKDGRIVSETYRNLTGPATRFISFSMAKSLTSLLIGLALEDGYIHSLDDQIVAYVPELKGSGYDGVTVRQALQMRSGVGWDENYAFSKPGVVHDAFENAIVRNVKRYTYLAPTLKRVAPPGSKFNYSTMETMVLGWMLEKAVRLPMAAYMGARLWQPMGMEADGFFIADGPPGVGRALNGMGYNAVLRDYARIGLMMLDNGKAMGRQAVPAKWVAESTASVPIPGSRSGMGYAYQWWTLPGTPAYLAIGLQGQFIYVDPATRTVVVKLSYFPPGFDGEPESIAFFRAASAWKV